MSQSELQWRRRPTQARSVATVEHLLDTAIEVLEETGWDGFTTNLLAKKAGVGVHAVYRYFPNKLSIVLELARKIVAEWDAWFLDFDRQVEATGDFVAVWENHVDLFVSALQTQPGGLAVRRAMQASPALHEVDQLDNKRQSELLAASMRRFDPQLKSDKAACAAVILIESTVAMVDLTLSQPSEDASALLEQTKRMHAAYLNALFSCL